MPVYGSGTLIGTLSAGQQITVWNHELISVASPPSPPEEMSSIAVGLHRDGNFPSCLSVEVEFEANPGAFQLDLQTADTNVSRFFVTKASMTTGLNGNFVGRMEVLNVVAKYARVNMVALTNAVKVTVKIA